MSQSIRIYRIRVERFPGVSNLDLRVCTPRGKPVNQILVAGATGCGKTRLLEAILWGLGLEELIQQAGLSRLDSPVSFPAEALVQLDVFLDEQNFRFVRQSGGLLSIFYGDDLKSAPVEVSKEALARLTSGVLYFSEHRRYRLPGPVSGVETAGRVTEAKRLRYLKTTILNCHGPSQEKLRSLENVWQNCFDDTALHEFIWKQHAGGEWDLLLRRTKRGDTPTEISVDQLSAGELDLFVLLGTLLYRQMPVGLLLLDKPELYLSATTSSHIKLMLERLAPGAQFVLSTDSDRLWDLSYSYERVGLSR